VDEKSAVLVEANGDARVVGSGKGAYFLSAQAKPEVCRPGTPLTFRNTTVYHAPSGSQFNLTRWRGTGGNTYSLEVDAGMMRSTQPKNKIY
jgi:cyanophycinase-like exopeptidase